MSGKKKLKPNRRRLNRYLVWTAAGAAMLAGNAQAQQDWTKRFRIGATTGFNIDADFQFGGEFAVSGSNPGEAGVGGVNHFYDDGYVRVDDTGNAQGLTSYWGYDNASQYDPATGTLTYSSTESFTQAQSGATVDDAPYLGFDMAYGGRITEFLGGDLGVELGFTLLPMSFEDRSSSTVVASRTVHQFNTGGIILPGAPYAGGPSGLGPTIPDEATALPSETELGTLMGSRELDVMLYQLRLGPYMRWHLGNRWSASLSGGFSMGIVDADYEFNESIQFPSSGISRNNGSFGDTRLAYGGYAEAMLYFRAEDNGELYLGTQFMSLGRESFGEAGRQAQLNMNSGLFVTAGIHWYF